MRLIDWRHERNSQMKDIRDSRPERTRALRMSAGVLVADPTGRGALADRAGIDGRALAGVAIQFSINLPQISNHMC